jgi:tRNA(Ile)-lysidine synthase
MTDMIIQSNIKRHALKAMVESLIENAIAQCISAHNIHTGIQAVCIAVSGGCDSMALLLGAHNVIRSVRNMMNIKLCAITVDHMLRPESIDEAEYVHKICKNLNIHHEILFWDHPILESRVQAQAREARYALITNWCKKHDINYIMTAHHLNDNIEQLLIAVTMGCGIWSMSIPERSIINDVAVLRPFLSLSKDACISYLKERSYEWMEDASNNSDKYLRNNIRSLVNNYLSLSNSDLKRIATSMENIRMSAKALDEISENFIKNNVIYSEYGYAKIHLQKYCIQSDAIRLSVLSSVLQQISRHKMGVYAARSRICSIKRIDSDIFTAYNTQCKICETIRYCRVEITQCGTYILVCRELGRGSRNNNHHIGQHSDQNGGAHMWSTMSEIEYAKLKEYINDLHIDDSLSKNQLKNIMMTIPVVRLYEKIVAIPVLDRRDFKRDFK